MKAADGGPAGNQAPSAAEVGKRGKQEMENIMRKVNDLEDVQNSLASKKQKALENLVSLQEAFEEKDKEINDCRKTYEKVMKALNEKRDKRDHLKEQVDECNKMMSGLITSTIKNSRKASSLAKDRNARYHLGERNAARGYSSAKEAAPHKQPATRTGLFGSGTFGNTAGSILGGTGAASAPNLTGLGDSGLASAQPM
eukprot:TRINITY_DN61871_c0_g1_i1.p1 TRINITY_DN61871_c0_g1~~TRINITY_DN61871_c0_g1_i1.p1  ORF type:complete len:198 (+),score=51.61 TRINITY_DN61871_c0_g1_i1:65-658(+)